MKAFNSERGISLLELAIVLPFLLLIVAGIVEYGFALRESQVVAGAAREGARAGAAHARINRTRMCSDSKQPLHAISCNDPDMNVLPSDPIVNAAKKVSCAYIRNASLNPSDWDIEATVPPPRIEDGTAFDLLTVSIKKSDQASDCLMCWQSIITVFKARSQATFALESSCQR